MVCKKCGTEVADELTFCTNCGEEMVREEPKKKFGNLLDKKKLIIIGGVVGAIVLIILAIVIFSGDPAEERVEDLYESVLEYDLNAVMEALPPQVFNYYKKQLDLGDSKLEIVDSKELKESRVKELDERYHDTYGTKSGYIEAVTKVEVEIEYKDKEISRDSIMIYVVKVDGDWYLDPLLTLEELPEAEIYKSRLPFASLLALSIF